MQGISKESQCCSPAACQENQGEVLFPAKMPRAVVRGARRQNLLWTSHCNICETFSPKN